MFRSSWDEYNFAGRKKKEKHPLLEESIESPMYGYVKKQISSRVAQASQENKK